MESPPFFLNPRYTPFFPHFFKEGWMVVGMQALWSFHSKTVLLVLTGYFRDIKSPLIFFQQNLKSSNFLGRYEYTERKTLSKNISEFPKHFSSRIHRSLFLETPCIMYIYLSFYQSIYLWIMIWLTIYTPKYVGLL